MTSLRDRFNHRYDKFFNYAALNNREYLLHDTSPRIHSILWIKASWTYEDEPDALMVPGIDTKHLGYPLLNIPFPFKKRR